MQGLIVRFFLGALGLMLLAWGLGMPMVAWLGAEAPGTITHVRRQLGDRGEAIPNRYAYAISYEFRLPDGSLAQGNTYRVGDYFSPGKLAKGSAVQVRYLPGFPFISEMQWHWAAVVEHGIVAAVGGLLLHLAARGDLNRHRPRRQKTGPLRNRVPRSVRSGRRD